MAPHPLCPLPSRPSLHQGTVWNFFKSRQQCKNKSGRFRHPSGEWEGWPRSGCVSSWFYYSLTKEFFSDLRESKQDQD